MAALTQLVLVCRPYESDRRVWWVWEFGLNVDYAMQLAIAFKHDIATGARRSMIAIGQ
jgi:hypothetical protein